MLARTWMVFCCVAACGGSTSSAPTTTPVAAPDTREPAPDGLEVRCEAPNVSLVVSGATLSPSKTDQHKTDGRWNELLGMYKLSAGDVHHDGELVGFRDTDYAFLLAQSKTATTDEIPAVQITGGGPDGSGFILTWKGTAAEPASAKATCTGSLLTATPAAAP